MHDISVYQGFVGEFCRWSDLLVWRHGPHRLVLSMSAVNDVVDARNILVRVQNIWVWNAIAFIVLVLLGPNHRNLSHDLFSQSFLSGPLGDSSVAPMIRLVAALASSTSKNFNG